MGWGKEWPKADNDSAFTIAEAQEKGLGSLWPTMKVRQLTEEEFKKKYTNSMSTHDPYTNPNAIIYYECPCGAILDPNTKSFAALNNHASEKGWKVRWRKDGMGYEPFCVECGKDVPE